MSISVSKMQVSRPRWNYSPTMQFFYRMIGAAMIDALHMGPDGTPTDQGLLARDWIATSSMPKKQDTEFVSFPACCESLGIDTDRWRVALLEQVDAAGDYDTDACWTRLEYLRAQNPVEDDENLVTLPVWARVVAAVDQSGLFAAVDTWDGPKAKKPRSGRVHPLIPAPAAEVMQLGFVM